MRENYRILSYSDLIYILDTIGFPCEDLDQDDHSVASFLRQLPQMEERLPKHGQRQ